MVCQRRSMRLRGNKLRERRDIWVMMVLPSLLISTRDEYCALVAKAQRACVVDAARNRWTSGCRTPSFERERGGHLR
jgi:hypothetical protein